MSKFRCSHTRLCKYAEDTYDGGYIKIEECNDCGVTVLYEYVPPKGYDDEDI